METSGRYSLEKAQEEASRMSELINSGEAKDYDDAAEKLVGADKTFIPYEECCERAKILFAKYKDEIRANLQVDMEGATALSDYVNLIGHYLKKIPTEIQEHYYGHGITRNGVLDRLAAAIAILENNVIKGDFAALENSGYINAYKDSDFLVLSKKDQRLDVKDAEGKQVRWNKCWVANIGAFVVNSRFYPMVDELKQLYPDVNIIRPRELQKYFEEQEGRSQGAQKVGDVIGDAS